MRLSNWLTRLRNLTNNHPASRRRRPHGLAPRSAEFLEERCLLAAVAGQVLWTDSTGATHPVPHAEFEVWSRTESDVALLQRDTTDANGTYGVIIPGTPDVFVRVYARSSIGDVRPAGTDADGNPMPVHFIQSELTTNLSEDVPNRIDLTAGNVENNETAFSVHHAVIMAGQYAGRLTGRAPAKVNVVFPTDARGSRFATRTVTLHVGRTDRWDWDVIQHEYGHYVAWSNGIDAHPNLDRTTGTNLTAEMGKDAGTRMAWAEGWPTFFALAAQQAMGGAALGIPNVGDSSYTETEEPMNGSVNVDYISGLGEDDEYAVMSSLLDLFDTNNEARDTVSISDRELFRVFTDARVTTIGAAWEALAAGRSNQERAAIGAVLGQSNIAPAILEPARDFPVSASAAPPTFKWHKGGGVSHEPVQLNSFRIRFYDSTMTDMLYDTGDLGNVDTYTPDEAAWNTILAGNSQVKWVVEGRQTSLAPATPGGALDWYWSGVRSLRPIEIVFVIDDTASMHEEIEGVRAALRRYIDELTARLDPEKDEVPMMQLITFKDDVTIRETTNVPNTMRTAVDLLHEDGGGRCPESSTLALQQAAETVADGGTILLATDASANPGVDVGALIARLRARGVKVVTILSGDCSLIGFERSAGATRSSRAPSVPESTAGVHDGVSTGGAAAAGSVVAPDVVGGDPSQSRQIPPDQPAIDDHGNDFATATRILPGSGRVSGLLGGDSDDRDSFRLTLEAGTTYSITIGHDGGLEIDFFLLSPDEKRQFEHRRVESASPEAVIAFTPPESGDYLLSGRFFPQDVQAWYTLEVREDPFAAFDSAVELFSTISAETGGAFLLLDQVNSGSPEEFENAMFNAMAGTLGPVVLSSGPARVPRGETLRVSLTGRNTNWRDGATSVSVDASGVTVLDVEVLSATSLTALLQVDADAASGFVDVTASSQVGAAMETATGVGVLEITEPLTEPAVLSVEPSSLNRGGSTQLIVRGSMTVWDASSTVQLGPGVNINSVTVRSAAELIVDVTVATDANIGFRTAVVVTGGDTLELERALFVGSGATPIPVIVGTDTAAGMPGESVTVTLTGQNTSFADGVTTASFGSGVDVAEVIVVDPVTVVVTFTIQPGTFPGFRDVSLTTDREVAVLLDGFFVDSAGDDGGGGLASIHGRKFNDLDGDGVRDASEPWLNGWIIELLGLDGNVVDTQVTMDHDVDGDGNIDPETERGWYWFDDVQPDVGYRVREQPQEGWVQTFPDDGFRTIASDLDEQFQLFSTGRLFEDWGGLGERWFMGAVDHKGVWFYITPDGTVFQWDYSPRFALSGTTVGQLSPEFHDDITLLTDAAPAVVHTVTPGAGETVTGIDFGNWQPPERGSIHGRKWHDLDQDGRRDANEPYLNGWTVELVNGDGVVIATQTTGDHDLNGDGMIDPDTERGWYWFDDVPVGVWTVGEVLPDGWAQTFPYSSDAAEAFEVDSRLGLYHTGNYYRNWGGRDEQWLRADNGDWHYLVPDGSLYRWNRRTASPLTGELVAQLSPSLHATPRLLFDAHDPSTHQVRVTAGRTVDNVDFGNIDAVLSDQSVINEL